jgi:hypothetical protein
MPTTKEAAILLVAAFVLCLPPAFWPPSTDLLIGHVIPDCFSATYWAGKFTGGWCMSASGGLGASYLLQYPPLPYYVATFFYPLRWAGIHIDGQIFAACVLACFISAVSCFAWLRDFAARNLAFFGALVYLYIPYRFDLLYFRVGYYELWTLSFLPLVALYSRYIAHNRKNGMPKLALAFALLMLCHPKIALLGAMVSGFYLLVVNPRRILSAAAAFLLAFAMAAYYFGPAFVYNKFLLSAMPAYSASLNPADTWANWYITAESFKPMNQANVLIGFAMNVLVGVIVHALIWFRRGLIPAGLKRDAIAWTLLFFLSLTLLFPASSPLWAIPSLLGLHPFPWRMQQVVALAFVAQLTLALSCLIRLSPKTASGNAICALFLMLFIGFSSGVTLDAKYEEQYNRLETMGYIGDMSFLPIWSSYAQDYVDGRPPRNVFDHARDRETWLESEKKIRHKTSEGDARINQWNHHGIILTTDFAHGGQIVLDHYYFPIWRAVTLKGKEVTLIPEDETGYMVVHAPPGKQTISLKASIFHHLSVWVALCYLLSAAGWASMFLLMRNQHSS